MRQLNSYNISNYVPILSEKKKIGWIHKSRSKLIRQKNESSSNIHFKQILDYSRKLKSLKRPEFCPVFNYDSLNPKFQFHPKEKFCDGKLFQIERNNLSSFGFPAYGVHCNVWSKYKNSTIIHFARRSKQLKSFPSFFDNPIAGGQPCGISIIDNLYKEAREEAGLSVSDLRYAKKSKTVHYIHNYKKKLNSSILFIYHLEKKDDLQFINQDGEVEKFISVEINKIYEILEKKILKPNSIIPILDFFILKESDFIPKKVMLEIKKITKTYD